MSAALKNNSIRIILTICGTLVWQIALGEAGRVDIRAVGDSAYVGDWSAFVNPEANSVRASKKPGNEPPPRFFDRRLSGIESLRSPHLNILNLEASLTRTCTEFSSKEFNFATLPKVAIEFARWGFNAIGLANNHSLDCVAPTSRSEINAAIAEVHKEYPGVMFHGVASSSSRLLQIATREINGVKIGLISIKGWATGARQNVGNLSNRRKIFAALRDAKVDVRILLLHGGTELKRDPDVAMIRVAREFLAEFNGDLVFGHHPHVIQGFEVLKKNNGRVGAVFYSLGNFLHDGLSRTKDGMVARVEVTKKGLDSNSLQVFPLANASWRPEPADAKGLTKALGFLSASNKFLEATVLRKDLERVPTDLFERQELPKSIAARLRQPPSPVSVSEVSKATIKLVGDRPSE